MLLLGRLALHYYRPDLIETQAKLIMEDMIEDLMPYDPREIAEACAAWRRDPEANYFPKSGQLIGKIQARHEAQIPHPGGHARVTHRCGMSSQEFYALPPAKFKPWRQILAEKGLRLGGPEKEAEPPKPAAQELAGQNGELSPERRQQLRELRDRVMGAQA